MKLPKIMNSKFKVLEELGSDYRGSLFRVISLKAGEKKLVRVMEKPGNLDIESINNELVDIKDLTHPNISFVRRIESIDRDTIAVFMDHKEGYSLNHSMKTLREDAEVYHQCVVQLCKGLDYLHQQGLCHWDIRPETILVHQNKNNYEIAFIDAGLSYYLDFRKLPHLKDSKFHKPAQYMSPEIIMGRGADCRSDLYSLGIVLFETATGTNPFEAPTTSGVVSAQLNKNAPQAKEINTNVSDETNALLLRLMAKESAFRPASASEVAREIARDIFQPTVPPRTGSIFTAHPLPRREIQSAFESSCIGEGSVLTLYGPSGVGKTELLNDIHAEFSLSGAIPVDLECPRDQNSGAAILGLLISELRRSFGGISSSFVSELYQTDHEDSYLRLADRNHLDNVIRKYVLELLSCLFISDDDELDTPHIFILRNCHFEDYVFWQFFRTLSLLLTDHPDRKCPAIWIIETNKRNALTVSMPSPEKHKLIELLPLDLDETNGMLSSLLGLTPFPDDVTHWVMKLSKGIPRRICLISDVFRNAEIVSWAEEDWEFDYSEFSEIEDIPDLEHLLNWLFDTKLNESEKLALNLLSLWENGCRYSEFEMLSSIIPQAVSTLHGFFAKGWLIRLIENDKSLLKFRYVGLKEWIHQNIPAYQKTEWHMIIAEKIAEFDIKSLPEISKHYLAADNRLRGCEYASEAARQFADTGSAELAIIWYQKILDNMPDRNRSKIAQISYELSQILISQRLFSRALKTLQMAEPIMDSRFHQKREKANYLMLIGICQFELEMLDDSQETLNEALSYLPKTTAQEFRLRIVTYLSNTQRKLGKHSDVIQLYNRHQKQISFDDNPFFAGRFLESVAWAYLEERQFQAAEHVLKESIHYGETLGDPLILISRYLVLGQIFERGHKVKNAQEEYERVITLARRGATRHGLARGLCHLASLNLSQHKTDSVEGMLAEATQLANRVNDPDLIVWSNILESGLFIEQGKIDEAERKLKTIEGLITAQLEPSLANRVYLNLAEIARRRANYYENLEYYKKLLNLANTRNQKHFIAFTYLYMAQTHSILNHLQQARELIEKARDLLLSLEMNLPDCDIQEANILYLEKQYKKARQLVHRGLQDAREQNLLHQQAEAHCVLGLIDFRENQKDKAIMELRAALDFYHAGHEDFEAATVHRHIAYVYESSNKQEQAKQEHESADRMFKKLSAFQHTLDYRKEAEGSHSLQHDGSGHILIDLPSVTKIVSSFAKEQKVLDILNSIIISFSDFERTVIFRVGENINQLNVKISHQIQSDDIQLINQHCSLLLKNQSIEKPVKIEIQHTSKGTKTGLAKESWVLPIKQNNQLHTIVYLDTNSTQMVSPEHEVNELWNFAKQLVEAVHGVQRNAGLAASVSKEDNLKHRETLITESATMKKLSEIIDSILFSVQPIHICGDSGTGKTFLAEHIHYSGRYSNQTLPVVQCQSVANSQKHGLLGELIEQCINNSQKNSISIGGNIIIEDINLLNKQQQRELLQLLNSDTDNGDFSISGYRIISTSTTKLRKLVQNGKFNETLYRSISQISLQLPSLSDRKSDIPFLALEFLKRAAKITGKDYFEFTAQAIEALQFFDWSNNLAELHEAVESAVLFGNPPAIELKDLPREIRNSFARSGALDHDKPALRSLDEVEEAHIRAILGGTNGNKLRTCEILEISRPTLDRKLEKYNIKIEKKRKR